MKILEKLPHIGMRKLKSILAMFIGFWVWQLVRVLFPGLEVHPHFIYIYGLLEIRPTSEKTKELGKSRIKATVTAICVALPVIALSECLQGSVSAQWAKVAIELILLMVGSLVTLTVAEKVGCKTFCGVAAAVFIILTLLHTDDERYIYSVLRAFQTILGVAIAWLINVKLFPYHGKKG